MPGTVPSPAHALAHVILYSAVDEWVCDVGNNIIPILQTEVQRY